MQFQLLKAATAETFRATLPYFKATLPLLFCVCLPFGLFEQFIFQGANQIEDKTLFGILGMLSSLLELFLVQLTLGYCVQKLAGRSNSVLQHYQTYFKELVVETLRSFGRVAIGVLFLIFPGIYRYIQYSLINYIVQFDPAYARGEVDALETSKNLLKGRFFPYALSFVLTQAVIIAIQFYGVRFILSINPIEWFLNFVVEISLSAFVYLFSYHYYKNLILQVKR